MTAAHLRELTALGVRDGTLIRVVEIIEEASAVLSADMSALSADKSADDRRGPLESTASTNRKERDKQRKRLARAAEKAARMSAQSSADQSELSADCPLSDCVVSSSLLSGEPLKKVKKEGLRARGTRLAPGTPLSAEHRAVILGEGIGDPERLWAEFVDYWSDIPGQRGIKISWTGTLRNRCRDVIKRGFNGTSKNGSNSLIGAIDRKLAALEAEAGADFALSESPVLRISG